jgi:uncharacterized repeat protein (TIGR02543 family)
MIKKLMLTVIACGMMSVTGARAQSGDIIGFYSQSPYSTYFAPGATMEFTIRLYGTIVVSNLFNTPVVRPEIRMEVGSDGTSSTAYATLVRSSWTSMPFDPFNRTDLTFAYTIRPGDIADPLKIFGTPTSGFTFVPNQCWIYKAYPGNISSNVTWKVNNNLFDYPGNNGLDYGIGIFLGDIDLSGQNICLRTLRFDDSNSPTTIIARQSATTWRIQSGATNSVPVKVIVWTPQTNVLQLGSSPGQALEVTIPAGSDYADFAVKGLNTNAIPTLATVNAQRPSDYAKNGTAVMNFISRAVTIEPPGPSTISIEFQNGESTQTLSETNELETGSFRIVLSEPDTSRVYVDFSVAHQPSTFTNIVITPRPDGYYVNAGQDKSGWYTFSVKNGTRESSGTPYVRIMPIATNTTNYVLSSPGILNIANIAPSVLWYPPSIGEENTPVSFEWIDLLDVDADLSRGVVFSWNFGDGGVPVRGTNYLTQGSIIHHYSNIGVVTRTYTVTLTVTDTDGGSYTLPTHSITISPAPKPANISVEVNRADATYPEGDTTAEYKVVLSEPAFQDTWVRLTGQYLIDSTSSDDCLMLTVTNNILIPSGLTSSVPYTMILKDGTFKTDMGIKIIPSITNPAAQAQYPGVYPGVLYIQNIAPAIDTVPTCQPTTAPVSAHNAIEMGKPFIFKYKATDVSADKTGTPTISVEFQFDDGTTKTSIGANGSVTNTFTSLGHQTVTMIARDKDGGETTLSFPITVVPPLPPPAVAVCDYPVFIAENDTTAKELTIMLSQTPASAGLTNSVVFFLDVTPTNSLLNGAVTVPASVTFNTSQSTKTVNFTVQDGTLLSATSGFTVTPRIAAGAPGSSVYTDFYPGQIFIQNVTPVFQQPFEGSSNTVATVGLPRVFSWFLQDATADASTVQLSWDWGDGTTSTTTGASGTTTHTYTAANSRIPVTVRATDKEGDYSIITFYVAVKILGVDPSANPSAIYISFDAQGGSDPAPIGYWLLNGMAYEFLSSTARSGYSFGGWWTSPDGGGSQILTTSFVNVTDPSRVQILYAKWIGNSYTLNFDGYETLSQMVTNGLMYGILPLPSAPEYYSFDGWYTGEAGTGVKITSNTVVNIIDNQTLYAHWVYSSFQVTFDPQGGSVTPATKSVQYQTSYAPLPTPTFDDAIFSGWWTEPNGKGTNIDMSAILTAASNHTLYAKWDINSIVGTTGLVWRTGDNAFWFPQGTVTNHGPLAMQSGHISDNETSWLETFVTGPCILRFTWKVDSEDGFDQLAFQIDSEVKNTISGKDQSWTTNEFSISAGEHNIRWEYTKDENESVQSDCGWLDHVELIRTYVIFDTQGGVVNPTNMCVLYGAPHGELPVATFANAVMEGWWTEPNGKGTRVTSNTLVQTYQNYKVYAKWNINSVLGTSNWVWSTDGTDGKFWFPESSIRHTDQPLAMQAGGISHNASTWIETMITNAGTLSFRWAISAEVNKDVVTCTTNGGHYKTLSSKTLSWNQESISVSNAPVTIRWTFSKDASTNVGTNSTWLAAFTWTPANTSSGFDLWAKSLGLAGTRAELFVQDRNLDGIANGFEYAFGTNLPLSSLLLNIRFVNGKPIVEIPKQDDATLPYVDVRVKGSTNLFDWTLPMIPATDTTGKPAHRSWHETEGIPPAKAFFKVDAELK